MNELKERLLPIIANDKLIYSDPLWQLLALILIVIFVFHFGLKLIKFNNINHRLYFNFFLILTGGTLIALTFCDIARQKSFNKELLKQLNQFQFDCSAEGEVTYQLLSSLTTLSKSQSYLISASWINTKKNEVQQLVADKLITKVLFKSLACRLEVKAKDLISELKITKSRDYLKQLQQVSFFSVLLVDYDKNREVFIELIQPLNNSPDIDIKLMRLINYLYDTPVPNSINTSTSLIKNTVKIASYSLAVTNIIDSESMLNHLDDSTKHLQTLLVNSADTFPLQELMGYSEDSNQTPMNVALQPSALFVYTTSLNSWLNSKVAKNPCSIVLQIMKDFRDELPKNSYNPNIINKIVDRFSKQECDNNVKHNLLEITVPPYGKMFETDENHTLVFSKALSNILSLLNSPNIPAFVSNTYLPLNTSTDKVIAWSPHRLNDLLGIIKDYQMFLSEYDDNQIVFIFQLVFNRFQQVTERLIHSAQISSIEQQNVSPKNISDSVDIEIQLNMSINNFVIVSKNLSEIINLLLQLKDSKNASHLQKSIELFAFQQLMKIDQLVNDSNLYKTAERPNQEAQNFAAALLSLESDEQIKSYLNTQHQRMSYIAMNYAEPLISFLLSIESADLKNEITQRWIHTLNDLHHFQYKEPNNKVNLLNSFISETLVRLTNTNCLLMSDDNGENDENANIDWFSISKHQIEHQAQLYCKKLKEFR